MPAHSKARDRESTPDPARISSLAPPVAQAVAAPEAVLVPGLAYGTEVVRAKLDVGGADDAAERAADRAAEAVVAELHPAHPGQCATDHVHRSVDVGATAPIGMAGGTVSPDVENQIAAARSGGRTLPDAIRRDMEHALEADFGAVNVHTGPQATALNEGMSARAFTLGNDIFFRDGLPDTRTPEGTRLLAHELTHVVQQQPGAARSTVRRDPTPMTVSAPTKVKIRTGEAAPVPVSSAASVGAALGSTAEMGKAKVEDMPGSQLNENRRAEAGIAAGDASENSMGSERAELEAMPTLSAIAIPGVAQELEATDPYKAVSGYAAYAGSLYQKGEKHDQEIESFTRFVEADHIRLSKAHADYQALPAAGGDAKLMKKIDAKKKALEDSVGADKLAAGVARENIWEVVLGIAEERSRLGAVARSNANEDIPLIDGVYEKARDAKTAVFTMTGGRSVAHAKKREAELANKSSVKRQKHENRTANMGQAKAQASAVGLAVREAYLSEGRLHVKVSQLKAHKTSIEAAVSAGDWLAANGKWLMKKGAGAALGLATAGILSTTETKDGALGMEVVTMGQRLEAEIDKAEELRERGTYGKRATPFHAGLQVFNGALREVRNVMAGVGVLLGLLGLLVTAFAPPVGLLIKGIAVTFGLIALALTAFKIVIDAVLLSWTAVERAITSSARNNNLLNAQGMSQGGELLGDAVKVGLAFGVPAIGNAGELGTHGASKLLNPVDNLQNLSGIGKAAPSLAGATTLGAVGQVGATVGVPIVGNIGVEAAKTGMADTVQAGRVKNKATAAATVPGPVAKKLPAATPPIPAATNEPKWIKDARASESATRDGSIDALVKRHKMDMGSFHQKTQKLMLLAGKGGADSATAAAKLAATKKPVDAGAIDTTQTIAQRLASASANFGADAAELMDPAAIEQELANLRK
ncbi:MAG: hypothetical protein QOF87_3393 [Pseudonocardiales bacterium]|jgi:hypothetical protein|nr:hypothetical protein [Pseudonocardiales bacterium]